MQDEDSDSSHSLASVEPDDVTVMGDEEQEGSNADAKKDKAFTASQVEVNILFWRNMALAFVMGTGIVLTVGAYLCLSRWNQLDAAMQDKVSFVGYLMRCQEYPMLTIFPCVQLPVIFTVALAVIFANFALVLYLLARHAIHLLTSDDEVTMTAKSSKIGLFSIRPLTSNMMTTKQNANKKKAMIESSLVDPTFRMDQSTDMVCPTVEGSCDSQEPILSKTNNKNKTGSKATGADVSSHKTTATPPNSSDQAVKNLHQSLGNLQDFLSNLRKDGVSVAVPSSSDTHDKKSKRFQSILSLSTAVATMPTATVTNDMMAQAGKPLAELFTDTTVLFADIEGNAPKNKR